MWLLTFHSTCLRILRMNAEKAGYNENLTVYDPVDQKAVIKKCIKKANVNDKIFTPKMVLSRISDAKEKGETSQEFCMNAASPKEKTIGELYSMYERELKENNAVDFDDMIWRVVDMFEKHPEVLEYYRDRFRYVMVDEYQDTNYMQYRFVKALAGASGSVFTNGEARTLLIFLPLKRIFRAQRSSSWSRTTVRREIFSRQRTVLFPTIVRERTKSCGLQRMPAVC